VVYYMCMKRGFSVSHCKRDPEWRPPSEFDRVRKVKVKERARDPERDANVLGM
jgi:hypothetical protein